MVRVASLFIFIALFLNSTRRGILSYALPVSLNETALLKDSPCVFNSSPLPQRTLFDVTWGCILTMVLCAWTSVHPNVPPLNRTWQGFWARMKMLFWTVVAPELILAWAVRQWFAAREIRNIYNNSFRGKSSHYVPARGIPKKTW